MEKIKPIIAKLLICFVIFCIGFSFGKNHRSGISTNQLVESSNTSNDSNALGISNKSVLSNTSNISKVPNQVNASHSLSSMKANKFPVKVIYMHATFRCDTCNRIETMAKSLLDEKLANKVADGDIVWEEINFQQRQDLAVKFKVIASCIVVEKTNQNGKSSFERLDKVWTLYDDKKAFDEYILGAVNRILAAN